MKSDQCLTLIDLLEMQARDQPEKIACSFIRDIKRDTFDAETTYQQILDDARDVAGWLRSRSYRPGDRALLAFSPGLEFLGGFFGCLYAGLVAVPAPLPERSRANTERLDGILGSAEPRVIITDDRALPDITDWLRERSGDHPPCVSIQHIASAEDHEHQPAACSPDTLAVIQYTSGSTSAPKGVLLTHRNLLANLSLIHAHVGAGADMRGSGWLPLTHDMGLIGQLLYPIFAGGWCLMLPPLEFIRRPVRWLTLISRHEITHTVAPDFAYSLCGRKVTDEQLAELDLSRWRVALNGAEPIQPTTIEAFAERMATTGFKPEAFYPCYGLAEATLLVSGKVSGGKPASTTADQLELAAGRLLPATPDSPTTTLVSSGRVLRGDVFIVEPETRTPLGDRQVGEIWIRSDCVAGGYWGAEEESRKVFGARTSDGRGPFLRTGDLGVREGAELYVVGRIKDVIIVHGRNVYPHDLEYAVKEQSGDLSFGNTAMFGVADEHIVLVQEVRLRGNDSTALATSATRIRHEITRRSGSGNVSVFFVRPGTVRRTTSGKISRSATRRLFLESGLDPVYESLSPELSVIKPTRR